MIYRIFTRESPYFPASLACRIAGLTSPLMSGSRRTAQFRAASFERSLEARVQVEVMFKMYSLINPLDTAMLRTPSIPQQAHTPHSIYESDSHVWMRPCPHCCSHLRKKSPEESWCCGCGWHTE